MGSSFAAPLSCLPSTPHRTLISGTCDDYAMGGYMQQNLRFDSVGATTTRQNLGASTRNYVFFQLTLDQVGSMRTACTHHTSWTRWAACMH